MESDSVLLCESVDGVSIRGYLHLPDEVKGCLVLTHGAGSNCGSPLLLALARAFHAVRWAVLRCDLPFRQERPQGPPPRGSGERDREGLRAAVTHMRQRLATRVCLGGHSYGGRQASMLAAEDGTLADCLLLLSYPLHPPRRPAELRVAHLPQLRTPALFVHGTRDGFGSIPELEQAIMRISARTALMPAEGAGHELLTRKNAERLPHEIAEVFPGFAGMPPQ